jgi:hypothetical protein
MEIEIRRLVTSTDEVRVEGGKPLNQPLRVGVVGAVVTNPLAGTFVEDLSSLRAAAADLLGALLCDRLGVALDGPIEAYGKGALVGLDGEIEHGSVVIHTLEFGDHLRKLAGGSSLVPSAEKRGPAGSTIDLALKHVNDVSIRSHHMTYEFRVPDAPHNGEMVVIVAGATGSRPHARSGSLSTELNKSKTG